MRVLSRLLLFPPYGRRKLVVLAAGHGFVQGKHVLVRRHGGGGGRLLPDRPHQVRFAFAVRAQSGGGRTTAPRLASLKVAL